MSRRLVVRALTGTTAAALLLSACGGGGGSNGLASKSSQQILSAAVKSVGSAQSARVTGDVSTGGHMAHLDMTLFKNGDADGTFGVSGADGSMIIIGSTVYFKGPAKFWQQLSALGGQGIPLSLASRIAGRWIKIAGGSSSFGTFSLQGLGNSLSKGSRKKLVKVGTSTVDGQSAVGIKEPGQGTMWVSTSGTAYPIELEKAVANGTDRVTFSNWNQASAPSAPSGAKSLQQLLG